MSDEKKVELKRDIFRFRGTQDTALNLEHITMITLEARKVFFNFYSNQIFVEFETEEGAKAVFDQVLNYWSSGIDGITEV